MADGRDPKRISNEAYRRSAESAARDYAAWPEWKKHPPTVPIKPEPAPVSAEERAASYKAVAESAARDVAAWPAWKRNPPTVPLIKNHRP